MRLFLAVDPSAAARAHLRRVVRLLAPVLPGWRIVAPDAIHLTLRFLGELDERTDRRLRAGWRLAATNCRAFSLATAALDAFPSRGAARVVWCGLGDERPAGAQAELADAVERAAQAGGLPGEHRAFRPHLTLARRGHGRDAARVDPRRGAALPEIEPGPAFDVRALTLYRSDLHRDGARYTVVDSFPLAEHGRRPNGDEGRR